MHPLLSGPRPVSFNRRKQRHRPLATLQWIDAGFISGTTCRVFLSPDSNAQSWRRTFTIFEWPIAIGRVEFRGFLWFLVVSLVEDMGDLFCVVYVLLDVYGDYSNEAIFDVIKAQYCVWVHKVESFHFLVLYTLCLSLEVLRKFGDEIYLVQLIAIELHRLSSLTEVRGSSQLQRRYWVG